MSALSSANQAIKKREQMDYLNVILACIDAYPNIWGLDKTVKLFPCAADARLTLGDFPHNICRVFHTTYVPCLQSRDADYQGWRALFQLSNGVFVFLEASANDFVELAEAWGATVKPNNYFDKSLKVIDGEGAVPWYGFVHHVPEIRIWASDSAEHLLKQVEFRSFATPWDTVCGFTDRPSSAFWVALRRGGRLVDGAQMAARGMVEIERRRAEIRAAAAAEAERARAAAAAAKAEEDRRACRYDLATFVKPAREETKAAKSKREKWDLSQLD